MRAPTNAPPTAETRTRHGRRATNWDRHFREVSRYVDTHGTLPRNSGGEDTDGDRLADWLSDQRKRRRRDLVTDDQRDRLETLPGFEWEPRDAQWAQRVRQYAEFLRSTNGKRPQIRSHNALERRLARWWGNHSTQDLDSERRQDVRALNRLSSELYAQRTAAA